MIVVAGIEGAILFSPDGTTWSSCTVADDNRDRPGFTGIAWTGKMFAAVGWYGVIMSAAAE
jgi:hypothetical protein